MIYRAELWRWLVWLYELRDPWLKGVGHDPSPEDFRLIVPDPGPEGMSREDAEREFGYAGPAPNDWEPSPESARLLSDAPLGPWPDAPKYAVSRADVITAKRVIAAMEGRRAAPDLSEVFDLLDAMETDLQEAEAALDAWKEKWGTAHSRRKPGQKKRPERRKVRPPKMRTLIYERRDPGGEWEEVSNAAAAEFVTECYGLDAQVVAVQIVEGTTCQLVNGAHIRRREVLRQAPEENDGRLG